MQSKFNNQLSLFSGSKRLWTYAVIIELDGVFYVKYGDHRAETKDGVIKYALDESAGKYRGVLSIEKNLIGVWDMTDHALSVDESYDPNILKEDSNYKKGYDNEIRDLMPFKKMFYTNDKDGRSLELHPVPTSYISNNPNWRSDIKIEWDIAHKTILNGSYTPELKKYEARQYLIDSFDKIPHSSKHLLAAATGSGKETSTLALLSYIHKIKNFGNDKLNVAVATIPSTISELLNELSTVSGISVGTYGFVDFSLIKIYLTRQWYVSYINNCNYVTRQMVNSKATIVDSVNDIPLYHEDNIVPVLFGSYHDIAQKSNDKLHPRYSGLSNRIGTFSIGESHQMLSDSNNKMWKQLNHSFSNAFKLFITGTPYDFIYTNSAAEFFDKNERSLFTRNDLYTDKRLNKNSDFVNYPDFNYYSIDVKEIISHLKYDDNWVSDDNGFTWQKFFKFDGISKKFKYEKSILWLFTRMFSSSAFDENGDKLSIYNAPDLCEKAKQHIMVALPPGNNTACAKTYIKELKSLLITHGIFQGTIFDAYEDNLGDRKNDISNSLTNTLTLTCIRDCTGANIPELGSFVFLRNIGNSVKFFEQATGRVGRVSQGKTNCGVFIGDLEATMSIMVTIEEKLSIDRNNDFSTQYIINNMLANYNYFTSKNGKWVPLDIPDFSAIIEQISAKGGSYGVNQCIKITDCPPDFYLKFNNPAITETSVQVLTDNGNKKSKNIMKFSDAVQCGIPVNDNKINWNNMKISFVAKCRLLAFIYNVNTVSECVILISNALISNDEDILKIVGNGVEYFPDIMSNHDEIDVPFTNRWIQKLNDNKHNKDHVLELFEDPIHRSKESFIAEPNELISNVVSNMVLKLLNNGIELKDTTFFDPCGGRGAFLLELFSIAEKNNYEINPKNIFFNDIDPVWFNFFKSLNVNLKLGIPEENITNVDLFEYNFEKNFDVIITNPPYSNTDTHRQNSNHKGQGKNLSKKCTELLLKNSNFFVVSLMPYGERTYSSKIKKLYEENGLYLIDSCNEYFKGVSSNSCAFYFDKLNNVDRIINTFDNHEYEIPSKNISSLMTIQPAALYRNQFESELTDTGTYKVVVTTNIIKYTNDKNLLSKLKDKSVGKWRVVVNCTTECFKIGKVIIADENMHLSRSVNCFTVNSEQEAIDLKSYLESDYVSSIIKDVKVKQCNSKKFFKFIPLLYLT